MEVLFCYVHRIHLSEFDEGLKEHSLAKCQGKILCDRHVCCYHECRAQPKNRFRYMIEFLDISCLEAVRQGPDELSEAILLCWRTMKFSSESQSSPASLKKLKLGE